MDAVLLFLISLISGPIVCMIIAGIFIEGKNFIGLYYRRWRYGEPFPDNTGLWYASLGKEVYDEILRKRT